MTYSLFDLLYLDGHLLVGRPYDERRVQLESLQLAGRTFATTDSLRDACMGPTSSRPPASAVSKASSRSGAIRRTGLVGAAADWRKVKNFRTQEVVVGGWTDGKGERQGSLGALFARAFPARTV